jgi:hypothetical protein
MSKLSLKEKVMKGSLRFACVAVLITCLTNAAMADILGPPAGLSPGDEFRWLFVTSQGTPALADIPAFDAHVDGLAAAAGHTTTGLVGGPTFASLDWRAVISSATSGAIPRLSAPGVPVYTLDGILLGPDLVNLLTAGAPVDSLFTEALSPFSTTGSDVILTGTSIGGVPSLSPIPTPYSTAPLPQITFGVIDASTPSFPYFFFDAAAIGPIPTDRVFSISTPLTVVPLPGTFILGALGLTTASVLNR